MDLILIWQQPLDKAGYTLRENGGLRTNEKGETISLKLVTNVGNPLRDQIALFIQEDLGKVGIQLEIEFLEWEDLKKQMFTSNYDLFLGGWELSCIPDITNLFHTSAIGSTNFIAYSNEKLDALLDVYLASSNPTLKNKISDIEGHIVGELPYISLF